MKNKKRTLDLTNASLRDLLSHTYRAAKGGNHRAALVLSTNAVKRFPQNTRAYVALGSALRGVGREHDAQKFLLAALQKFPTSVDICVEYMELLYDMREDDQFLRYLPKAHRVIFEIAKSGNHSPVVKYSLNNIAARSLTLPGLSTKQLTALHIDYQDKQEALPKLRKTIGGVKIGIYCRQILNHAVGYFCRPFLKAASRRGWDITVFYDDQGDKKLHAKTKRFLDNNNIELVTIDLARHARKASEKVKNRALDVIIEMGGRFDGNYMPLLRERLAPIQVSWIGYPHHPGYSEIDYFISDTFCTPYESTEQDSLKTYRLDRFFSVYEPSQHGANIHTKPTSGQFTFGSFNHIRKINANTVQLWAKILASCPDSKLLIKSRRINQYQETWLLKQFVKANTPHDRIIIDNSDDERDNHMRQYLKTDVCLDTYPYCGTTTTCEALYMGVPVITLLGDMHLSRVSAGILNAIGCPELIAQSEADYVEKCVSLYNNRARVEDYRNQLRPKMLASELCDADGMVDAFQDFLSNVTSRHFSHQPDNAKA